MLQLSKLTIANFRSVEGHAFDFPGLTFLVGKNDAGKSNVLNAIQILLEGGSNDLSELDYYDRDRQMIIEAEFSGADRYLALCDEKNRSKIADRLVDAKSIRVRKTADRENGLSKLEIFDPRTDTFSTPTGIDAPLKVILPEIIFIGALDDVSQEAEGSKKGAISKLMSQILSRVKDKLEPQITKAYSEANRLLNLDESIAPSPGSPSDQRIQEIKDLESRISEYLAETFPAAAANLKVSFPSVDQLFKGVDIWIKENRHNDPYFRRGHGLQRALYLSLLRTLAFYIRQDRPQEIVRPFMLLFEEPETCLHPGGQIKMRRALQDIAQHEQVIVATHSAILIAPEMIRNTLRLEKVQASPRPPITKGFGPLSQAELLESEKEIERLFEVQRSSKFLFARGVLFVEGIADEYLVSAAGVALMSFDLEFHEIAVVESGGKDNIPAFLKLVEKLGLQSWALVDLDFLWRGAGEILTNDAAYAKFCQELKRDEVPIVGTPTEAQKKEEKKRRVNCCRNELKAEVDDLCTRLLAHRVYVLRHGEIECYFGMSESSKGKYASVAKEVRAMRQSVSPREDFEILFTDLSSWALASRP